MLCADHPETQAIGSCYGCGRNICSVCFNEINGRLQCGRESCKQKMEDYDFIMDSNMRILSRNRWMTFKWWPAAWLLLLLLFIIIVELIR